MIRNLLKITTVYLNTRFQKTTADIRQATVQASLRRVRPCLMITATTLIALIPVLTASGRGLDIMVPMAIPTIGGMLFEVITMLVVPVLFCWREENRLPRQKPEG